MRRSFVIDKHSNFALMKSKTLEGLMTAPPMPADRFWQVIEHTRFAQDRDAHVQALRTALRKLSLEELISFEVAFRRYLNTAYTWDLRKRCHSPTFWRRSVVVMVPGHAQGW